MRHDRRGNMPFALVAVTLLLMATVAGAVMAEHARSDRNLDLLEEGAAGIDEALGRITSYVDQELGIVIFDISRDDSLGTVDDRADIFKKRADEWMDTMFPMVSNGIRAELVSKDLHLTAEPMGLLSDDGSLDGYMPSYLHGSGTIEVDVTSGFAHVRKTLEVSTDGSYALPLAAEQGSLFERMTGGGGLTIAEMMTYELTMLAQYRVLNGYGCGTEYGPRGTDAIITQDDVRMAYEDALSLIGTVCFRDYYGDVVFDRIDLADRAVGDSIEIDVQAFYGQVLASLTDDMVTRWMDYLFANCLIGGGDLVISMGINALDDMLRYFTGKPTGAQGYIAGVMGKAGIPEQTYRYPGSGRTTVSVDGITVTVENPCTDILSQPWITDFTRRDNLSTHHIEDFLAQVLNSAAQRFFDRMGDEVVTVRIDPYDDVSFADSLSEAFRGILDGCEGTIASAVEDSLREHEFVDPFYASIADEVLSHSGSLADSSALRNRISSAFAEAVGDDEERLKSILSSPEIDRAVHAYQNKVNSDLSEYQRLKEMEGRPNPMMDVLAGIVSLGLVMTGITSNVDDRSRLLVDEIMENCSMEPYAGVTEVPGKGAFALLDDAGNRTTERLTLSLRMEPVIDEPVVEQKMCSHVTGFRQDAYAAYTTTFRVHLSDIMDYRIGSTNSFSAAMGAAETSAVTGSVSNDIVLEIPVVSAWALMGVRYTATETIVDDAVKSLLLALEPIKEPLRKAMEMMKRIISVLNEALSMIAKDVTRVITLLYTYVIGPLTEIAEWIEDWIDRTVGESILRTFFSLDLSKQTFGLEYMGYTLTIDLNLATLASSTKTLFTATIAGKVSNLDVEVSITAKVKGDMKAENVFVTGKATVEGEDWKVKVGLDPLMKGSKHLMTLSAEVRDVDVSVILPDLEDYHELGFRLSSIPGVGDALSNIPLPAVGVMLGLNAGVSVKYSLPVKSGLMINEYETNPPGNDKGGEWVELFNNSDRSIDLTDYTLIASSDSRSKRMTLSGEIMPGEYLVIEPKFSMVNSSGKMTKNGEGLTLKDPSGEVVDKTGTHKDGDDDGNTWQRKYDGSSEWVFAEGTMGRSNGSFVAAGLLTIADAKSIVVDAVKAGFEEAGPITDLESMGNVIRATVVKGLDSLIDKVSGCLVEASVYVEADLKDATSTLSGGVRIALRCDSELVEDVLKYIVGKVEELVLSISNPYKIDFVSAFTDNIDLEVTADGKLQFPRILAKENENLPKMDLGVTFRTNVSGLMRVFGEDAGTPGVEAGIRIIDCPAVVIPSKMSPKKDMTHDLWLIKVGVEWT